MLVVILSIFGMCVCCPGIVGAAKWEDLEIRSFSTGGLPFHFSSEMEHKMAIDQALAELKETDPQHRQYAVGYLFSLGAQDIAASIAPLLDDPSSAVRSEVIKTLAAAHASSYTTRIALFLRDPHPRVRAAVAEALCALGAKEYAADVAKLLSDDGIGLGDVGDELIFVKAAAAHALGSFGSREYAGAIAALLNYREHASVRGSAARALGRLQATEYADVIAVHLTDYGNADVWWDCMNALVKLGAHNHADDIARGLKDHRKWVALAALDDLQAVEQAPKIAALLRNRTDWRPGITLRAAAVWTLGDLQAKEYAGEIAGLLYDMNPGVRSAAREVLRHWGLNPQATFARHLIRRPVALLWSRDGYLGAMAILLFGWLVRRSMVKARV